MNVAVLSLPVVPVLVAVVLESGCAGRGLIVFLDLMKYRDIEVTAGANGLL